MLGTGHAMTVECFNTCFIYLNEHGKVLVDTGGGQQLVGQMRAAGISAHEIDHVFISHRHTDHLLGLPWFIRMRMKNPPEAPLRIYAHEELCLQIKQLICILFPDLKGKIGSSIILETLQNGDKKIICEREFQFFDTFSETCLQYGFSLNLSNGDTFVFCGDVPLHENNYQKLYAPKYLKHEAFALSAQMLHNPGKHASVAQAAKCAQDLGAENLIIVHCSDQALQERDVLYVHEASQFFSGKILVPYDLDQIEL